MVFAAILVWAATVFTLGIGWGLPSSNGWAGDEIRPVDVERGARRGFTGGWYFKYPPLHYRALDAVYRTLGALERLELLPAGAARRVTFRFYAGRYLSVVLSLGTVVAVFLLARLLFGVPAALGAAFAASCLTTLTYFAKTANPVAPFVASAMLSLLALARAVDGQRWRDYLLLGATAAAAVTTKDEAYGLYILTPVVLGVGLARRAEGGRWRQLRTIATDPRPWVALAVFCAVVAAVYRLPGNLSGFVSHFRLLRSGTLVDPFRSVELAPAGELRLLGLALGQLVLTLGPLIFAAALAGLWAVARRPRGRDTFLAGGLLILAAGHYLAFVAPLRYSYPRFLLPEAVILCLFAGVGLARLAEPGPWKLARRAALAIIVLYSALLALSIDLRMRADSRYDVEEWIARHRRPGEVAVAVGPTRQSPRLPQVRWAQVVRSDGAALRRRDASFVVVNVTDLRGPRERDLYRRLLTGDLGYRLVLCRRGEPWFDLLGEQTLHRLQSELEFVDPKLAVFASSEVAARFAPLPSPSC